MHLSFHKTYDNKLAQEKKVPAYIIFSDMALIDMCRITPANEDEFPEEVKT
ncbi:MAG: HRDC domain-containing protein [Thermoclostridium sp.]|nr:HRDC domain-containing protein [Thermoclostridium sp.]